MLRVYLDGAVEQRRFPIAASVWAPKAFSPDGSRVAVSRSGAIKVYDFATDETREFDVEHSRLGHFSPDGSMLSLVTYYPDAENYDEEPLWATEVISATTGQVLYHFDSLPPVVYQIGTNNHPVLIGFPNANEVYFVAIEGAYDAGATGMVWKLEENIWELTPSGFGNFAFDMLPETGERAFRTPAQRSAGKLTHVIEYAPPEGPMYHIYEALEVDETHFIDGGRSLAFNTLQEDAETGDTWRAWVLLQRDGSTSTLPLGEDDAFVIGAPGGYVFLRSLDEGGTALVYHQFVDGDIEETVLWQDDGSAEWQIVWASPMPAAEGLEPFPMWDNRPMTGDY
jgi:hypothetical protein